MHVHNKWGLLNSLLNILNTYPEESLENSIAKYFLTHFADLPNINIFDAAAECYTSRAGIRRFCQSLGYDNFKDMKLEAKAYYEESKRYYFSHQQEEPDDIAKKLYQMAIECNHLMSLKQNEINGLIKAAKQIVFIVSDVYSKDAIEFQKYMILSGKMVRIISDKFDQNPIIQNLESDDLIFTISVSGFFERQIRPLIQNINCQKVLMTAERNPEYAKIYQTILYISEHPVTENHTVYHTYAVEYCLDYLLHVYHP